MSTSVVLEHPPDASKEPISPKPPEDDCPIENLNEDTLLHIFKYLSVTDCKQTSLVCWKWYTIQVGNRNFYKQCGLTLDYCLISRKCPPWTVLMESGRRFVNIGITANVQFAEEYLEFFKKIGQYTEKLRFYCPNDNNFEHPHVGKYENLLRTAFPNLQEIRYIGLDSVLFDALPSSVQKIWIMNGGSSALPQVLTGEQHAAISELKNLKELNLSWINPSKQNKSDKSTCFKLYEVDAAVMELMKRSPCSLKVKNTINFLQKPTITESDIVGVPHKFPGSIFKGSTFSNLLEISVEPVTTGCFDFHQTIDFRAVKLLKVTGRHQKLCKNCREHLIESCPSISEINFVEVMNTDTTRFLKKFTHQLKVLELQTNMPETLYDMHRLRKLILSDIEIDVVRLTSLLFLCPNIRTLELHRCRTNWDQLELIISSLTKLEKLTINGLEKHNEEDLVEILSKSESLWYVWICDVGRELCFGGLMSKLFQKSSKMRFFNGFLYMDFCEKEYDVAEYVSAAEMECPFMDEEELSSNSSQI